MPSGTSWLRGLSGLRAIVGLLELAGPSRVLPTVTGRRSTSPAVAVVRVLGARQVVQAATGLVHPTPAVAELGAAVDTLHAMSMVAWALGSRDRRRGATVEALMATGLALAGLGCRARLLDRGAGG